MRNLSLRQRIYGATAVAALLIVAVFYFLLWKPTSNKISTESSALAQAQQQLTTLNGQVSSLKSFQQQLPAAQAEANRLTSAVPTTPELSNFILALNSISQKSGISFISISPAQAIAASVGSSTATTTANPNLYQVQVGLQVGGGYFQVLDFINRLDHLPRLVIVNSINLTSSNSTNAAQSSTSTTAATNSGTQLSASLKLTIFSQSAPIGEPGSPSTGPAGATTKVAPPSNPASTTAG